MASAFQIAFFPLFAMLIVGLISTISMKVSPSGSDTSLLVVKQILWVQIPRVTSGNYALPHGCKFQPNSHIINFRTYLGTTHSTTIKSAKRLALWKNLTNGHKNPPVKSSFQRPEGPAPQILNIKTLSHKSDVQISLALGSANYIGQKPSDRIRNNNF